MSTSQLKADTTGLQDRCTRRTHVMVPPERAREYETILQRSALDPPLLDRDQRTLRGVLESYGQPLDPPTRAFFEPRFGHDFSQVRVHADARAAVSARALHAQAYTMGRDVVFGAGQYAPWGNAGQKLLAHELTHVVQQTKGASCVGRALPWLQRAHTKWNVGPVAHCKAIGVSQFGDPLEKEADDIAERVLQERDLPGTPLDETGHSSSNLRPAPAATPAGSSTRVMILRSPGPGDVEAEVEEMGEQFRAARRADLSRLINDLERFPAQPNDPSRGFRAEDLRALSQQGRSLSFSGSLSPLPETVQNILLRNIEATVRFALDARDAQRIAQIAELQRQWERVGASLPWFDRPAGRVDSTDLYHGHVVAPAEAIQRSARLLELERLSGPYNDRGGAGPTIGEQIERRIGIAWPTTRPEARQVLAVAEQNRAPFLRLLDQVLPELMRTPGAAVLYHTYEWDRPRVDGRRLPSSHPIRQIVTSLASNRPVFDVGQGSSLRPIISFSFRIDRQGRVTLFPGASGEMIRAAEILAAPTSLPAAQPVQRQALADGKLLAAAIRAEVVPAEGSGHPLPQAERAFFESRFQHDFTGVRIHADQEAAHDALVVRARAYTTGHHVVFGAGAYAPGTPAGRRLLAHELVHVLQQQGKSAALQREAAQEAGLPVLRAALLNQIRRAHALTANTTIRQELDELADNLPAMDAAALRAEIPHIQSLAQTSHAAVTGRRQELTPSPTPTTLDPLWDDPDAVMHADRNHRLFQLISFLNASSSPSLGVRSIRYMLQQMGTTLERIHWFASNDVGFAASVSLTGTTGTPPVAAISIVLGPSMLLLMQGPSENTIPILAHEVYHAFAAFQAAVRPNLSETAMTQIIDQVTQNGAPDVSFGPAALGVVPAAREFARVNESEIYANLVTLSALADPALSGQPPRTVATGHSMITINNRDNIQRELAEQLSNLRLVFGPDVGAPIAHNLAARADSESLIHPDVRQLFHRMVATEFPSTPTQGP